MFYRLIRPLLFHMEPERAHRLALSIANYLVRVSRNRGTDEVFDEGDISRRNACARDPPESFAVRLRQRVSLHVGNTSGILPPSRMARCGACGVSRARENSHGL